MKVTVVIPIHNEMAHLPKSLPSVYNLGVDEVIWGLDRCTDESEAFINLMAPAWPKTRTLIRTFTAEEGQGWRERLAYLFRTLVDMARNDTILTSGGDIWLDPIINYHLESFPGSGHGLMSFDYLDHPINYQTVARRVIVGLGLAHPTSGIMVFSRAKVRETEDREDLRVNSTAEDTHLRMAIESKYSTIHLLTDSLHFRHSENVHDHLQRGQGQWRVQRKSLASCVAHSLVMLRPLVLVGYIQARWLSPSD